MADEVPPVWPEPKKVNISVFVDKVRNLPQTDMTLFGGKGCNPYVKLRLCRGNPVKNDEV